MVFILDQSLKYVYASVFNASDLKNIFILNAQQDIRNFRGLAKVISRKWYIKMNSIRYKSGSMGHSVSKSFWPGKYHSWNREFDLNETEVNQGLED